MEDNKITISLDEYNALRDIKIRAESAVFVLGKIPYTTETNRLVELATTILNGGAPDVS